MFSLKRTALFVTVLATFFCMLNPAMAAELSVKANSTKAGVSHVQVPYISGAVGGKQVDAAVNRAVFSYVNAQLKQLLSAEEVKTFDSMHQDNGESDNMLHYNADLVKYTDKKLTAKSENGRITASWYVQSAYEVKTAKDTFYSVILKTKTRRPCCTCCIISAGKRRSSSMCWTWNSLPDCLLTGEGNACRSCSFG